MTVHTPALLRTGLRMDDLRHLRWSEVNLRSGVITVVMRKTKETAMVPISPELRQALLCLRKKPVVGEYVAALDAVPVKSAVKRGAEGN